MLCYLSLAKFSLWFYLTEFQLLFDPLMRKEHTGFRKGRSCEDHVFTLRQTGTMPGMEHANQCKLRVFRNAFRHHLQRQRFCLMYTPALLNPPKTVSMIKLLCGDINSKVNCGQYPVRSKSRSVCLGIVWVMKETILGINIATLKNIW